MKNYCSKGECEKRELLAALRQCQTELEEAAKLFRPTRNGMSLIYTAAAERVKAVIAKSTR